MFFFSSNSFSSCLACSWSCKYPYGCAHCVYLFVCALGFEIEPSINFFFEIMICLCDLPSIMLIWGIPKSIQSLIQIIDCVRRCSMNTVHQIALSNLQILATISHICDMPSSRLKDLDLRTSSNLQQRTAKPFLKPILFMLANSIFGSLSILLSPLSLLDSVQRQA